MRWFLAAVALIAFTTLNPVSAAGDGLGAGVCAKALGIAPVPASGVGPNLFVGVVVGGNPVVQTATTFESWTVKCCQSGGAGESCGARVVGD